jgi:hypothetical protein
VSLLAPTLAVLDTNVFIDIHSCHDLKGTFDRLHSSLGDAAIDEPVVEYRLRRARESLLLAMYLNKISATTYSLHNEAVELLMLKAPPSPGGHAMESDFTTVFVHFVKDYVLPDWSPTMPTEPGSEASNEADRALVAYAKDNGLPLITNEGNTPDGIIDEKMRKLARDAGVAVFAPFEFYDGKINETEEVDAFLARFRHEAPRYLSARNERDEMWKVLQWIEGYYRMVLRGEVAGRDAPIHVSRVR